MGLAADRGQARLDRALVVAGRYDDAHQGIVMELVFAGNDVDFLAPPALYRTAGLLPRAHALAAYWADGVHSLRGLPHVIDLRNLGLIGAVELDPIPGKPGLRGYNTFVRAFEQGLLIRVTGDIVAMSPPLIIEQQHIDQVFGILGDVLKEIG